ncbi:hypothetical protein LCGC14_0531400 [marine sediment metagenome]|uniref:Uncharacterized protein n=1 Tax=marine sediment metagenome TaxID=412755 RepID=A0A0F9S093_9ZZZZ
MVNTSLSQVVLDYVVLEGRTRARIIWGKLASTYKPGQAVYESSTRIFTTGDASTAGHHLIKMGLIEFNPRTTSGFGEVDIDTAYATTDDVPIIIGSMYGPIKVAAFHDNPSGAVLFGVSFVISDTAGQWKKETLESAGSVSGTAIRYVHRLFCAEEGLANGDTKGLFYYA